MERKEAIEVVKKNWPDSSFTRLREALETLIPELKESEDERIRKEMISYFKQINYNNAHTWNGINLNKFIAWLEEQGSEPNWCHHKVDLSECSEEYRKAYYDGWNNCNMQHSQCKSELDDVVKCLINGMKFYYEDNEKATWGTDKWSMPVKHIIEVLENQGEQKPAIEMKSAEESLGIDSNTYNKIVDECIYGEQKPIAWSEEDEKILNLIIARLHSHPNVEVEEYGKDYHWLNFLKERAQPKREWSEEDENTVASIISSLSNPQLYPPTIHDIEWLKSLKDRYTWKPTDEQMDELENEYLKSIPKY